VALLTRAGENQAVANEFNQLVKGVSLSRDAWRRLRKNRMALAGGVVVIVYILVALLAPVLPIHSYTKIVLDHQNLPPSLTKTAGELLLARNEAQLRMVARRQGRSELNADERAKLTDMEQKVSTETTVVNGQVIKLHEQHYLLGTDYHGRDMLARIIYGSQISIAVGIVGTLTSVLLGIVVGAVAGYFGGRIDYLITRVIDVMYGLPYMLIVIIFMAIFGRNIVNLFVALSLVSWLTTARVVRGQVISLKQSEFVEAARSVGAGAGRIIFRHLLPNTLGIIIVYSTLRVPSFIMQEAFLSFLGLGLSAPFASWGTLVGDAIEGMNLFPWQLFFPALAMTLFLFAMNFLGDGLRDAFDPQSKNRL
jgi:oligopeptide transport system permease protein